MNAFLMPLWVSERFCHCAVSVEQKYKFAEQLLSAGSTQVLQFTQAFHLL